jgi:hypothetical protein
VVTLRCTQRLLKRLRVKPSADVPAPSSPLGDWYAAPFAVGHLRLTMCVSEKSLLPTFVRSQSLAGFLPEFREAVAAVLRRLGIQEIHLQAERQHLADIGIGSTSSRSVLGSMNDFAVQGRSFVEMHGGGDLVALALDLADTPCGPLQYRHPGQVVRELLGAV